jgi:hypothetical protein
MCKPLTLNEWKFIRQLLAGVSVPPEGIEMDHLRETVIANVTLAESRNLVNNPPKPKPKKKVDPNDDF